MNRPGHGGSLAPGDRYCVSRLVALPQVLRSRFGAWTGRPGDARRYSKEEHNSTPLPPGGIWSFRRDEAELADRIESRRRRTVAA
jgi:hypothetical protein